MGEPDQAADGGEVDDAAAARLAHLPRRRLAAVERAAEVDRDHVLPLLRGHRVDVADLADARAIDEDVDAAGGVDDALDSALDRDRIANVALDEEMRSRPRLLEGGDELVGGLA